MTAFLSYSHVCRAAYPLSVDMYIFPVAIADVQHNVVRSAGAEC